MTYPAGSPLAREAMAFVLAGGRGSRLAELTAMRAKPAVYFGGKSRIIDFALSNAINSGIRRIGVATQYKAHSLIRHLQLAWNFMRPERNESFDILPASQRVNEHQWYEGTADAVFQNLDIVGSYRAKYMVILAGDHIYKMDYEVMLQQHAASGADVTVACMEIPAGDASAFGIMEIDADRRIVKFWEKPERYQPPAGGDNCLASMGIYVFNTTLLFDILRRDSSDLESSHDFGSDIIPRIIREGFAIAHPFSESCVRSPDETTSYWRDVGTIDAYWAANIDLTDVVPRLDVYDRNWPLWTYSELSPPAKFVHDRDGRRGEAISSLVAGDCIISGGTVRGSLISTGCRVNSFSTIEQSVILPGCTIGRSAQLNRVILDRGVKIPPNLVVGVDPQEDARRFRRTSGGITLITRTMIEALE